MSWRGDNCINHDETEQIKELLLGRTVSKVEKNTLLLDDGRKLVLHGNEGCGGCGSGWYELETLNECPINAITNVEVVDESDDPDNYDSDGGHYRIFVLAQDTRIELATFEGSDGNGYYGTGFWIEVKES